MPHRLNDKREGWASSSIAPDDFEAIYGWRAAPTPPSPGKLTGCTLTIGSDPSGRILFHHYEERDREKRFEVTERALEELYQLMLDKDMFRDTW